MATPRPYRDLLFVSGQLPVHPDGTHVTQADFATQCRTALGNLLGVLAKAGLTPAHVIKVTAYIVGVERCPEFDRVYEQMFAAHAPARSVFPVASLQHGYLIEVTAIATATRD